MFKHALILSIFVSFQLIAMEKPTEKKSPLQRLNEAAQDFTNNSTQLKERLEDENKTGKIGQALEQEFTNFTTFLDAFFKDTAGYITNARKKTDLEVLVNQIRSGATEMRDLVKRYRPQDSQTLLLAINKQRTLLFQAKAISDGKIDSELRSIYKKS